jgi:predicted ester cyclase/N-acetylglutamate synthase-like GNAT family acetyltransferase
LDKVAPMRDCKIEFVDTLPKEVEEQMDKGFQEYESTQGIDVNYKKFSLILRDGHGNALGVLSAYTVFAEIYVDHLWVHKSIRDKGHGRKLLQALEDHFKGKGFNNINLVTNAFQAPEFYTKCGFTAEFIRENVKNPKLTKTFFIKYFDDEVQTQGILNYVNKPELARTNTKAIAEEYAHRIWDKKDLSAIADLLHPNIVIHSLLGDFHGPEAMRNVVQAWLAGFPDLIVTNISTICERDLATIQWQARGMHQGAFKGIKPTDKPVSYAGVTIYRIHESKITEYWAYLDMQHLLQQLI